MTAESYSQDCRALKAWDRLSLEAAAGTGLASTLILVFWPPDCTTVTSPCLNPRFVTPGYDSPSRLLRGVCSKRTTVWCSFQALLGPGEKEAAIQDQRGWDDGHLRGVSGRTTLKGQLRSEGQGGASKARRVGQGLDWEPAHPRGPACRKERERRAGGRPVLEGRRPVRVLDFS